MDPTRFEVTDIYKTSVCPLAKVMRSECRKRKIKHLKVVYSKEPVMTPIEDDSISCKNHCICPPAPSASAPSAARSPVPTPLCPPSPASSSAARSSRIWWDLCRLKVKQKFKSACPKIGKASAPTGAPPDFFGRAFFFGIIKGEQPLIRAPRFETSGAFLVLFWHAKENISGVKE